MNYSINSRWLWLGSIVLLAYPVSLCVQMMWDYLLGDSALVDYYLYESKRRLLKIVLVDWLNSFFVILPTVLFFIICRKYLPKPLGLPILLLAIIFVFAAVLMSSMIPTILGLIIAIAALPAILIDWSNNDG